MSGGTRERFLREAIRVATENIESGGGPFGAVVVRDGEVIARATNRVTPNNDPTAHAEIEAIREACRVLGTFQLDDCEIYASSEPCPMCLGAVYWARPRGPVLRQRSRGRACRGLRRRAHLRRARHAGGGAHVSAHPGGDRGRGRALPRLGGQDRPHRVLALSEGIDRGVATCSFDSSVQEYACVSLGCARLALDALRQRLPNVALRGYVCRARDLDA